MRGRLRTILSAAALLGGAAALLFAAAPALALDAAAEQAAIGSVLQAGYHQGYAAKDAAPIVALYDERAEIVTYTAGRLDRAAFQAMLGKIFKGWKTADAQVAIEEASFPGDDQALVTFQLQVSGTAENGKPVVRQDRWYSRLRRSGKSWLITNQGYRSDFGVMTSPHDDRGKSAPPPSSHGVWQ
jgi:ketosteroid isomerase-like protein